MELVPDADRDVGAQEDAVKGGTYFAEKSALITAAGLLIIGFSVSDRDWGVAALGAAAVALGLLVGYWYVPNRSRARRLQWLGACSITLTIGVALVSALGEVSDVVLIVAAGAAAFGAPWLAGRLAPEDLEATA